MPYDEKENELKKEEQIFEKDENNKPMFIGLSKKKLLEKVQDNSFL